MRPIFAWSDPYSNVHGLSRKCNRAGSTSPSTRKYPLRSKVKLGRGGRQPPRTASEPHFTYLRQSAPRGLPNLPPEIILHWAYKNDKLKFLNFIFVSNTHNDINFKQLNEHNLLMFLNLIIPYSIQFNLNIILWGSFSLALFLYISITRNWLFFQNKCFFFIKLKSNIKGSL